jgi:hypothetical protein
MTEGVEAVGRRNLADAGPGVTDVYDSTTSSLRRAPVAIASGSASFNGAVCVCVCAEGSVW